MIAGRYSLDREIGRGGTGVVWLGRDEVLGRNVALKRIGLLPGADSTDLARAEREARLSAQLNHPHVVAVFDVVIDPDAHWLVMEYVDGVTLSDLVRQRGRLSPEAAAPLLWQVADALVAAHGAGIVHRDVKPSNIMVNSSGQVKLTDFGIARIATDPSLTQTGMVTGSPAYLAPEVATGDRGGDAGDVWSLGATVFFVLAGRAPYEVGDNVLSALYRIVNEEPPRLGDAGWMTPLLEGTMVRDPAQRWTMKQVRDFLADPQHRAPTMSTRAAGDADRPGRASGTRPLTTVAPELAPEPEPAPEPIRERAPLPPPVAATGQPARSLVLRGRRRSPRTLVLAGLGLVLALVLAVVLFASLAGRDPAAETKKPAETPASTEPADEPTEEGMEAFIRDYVSTVADDPDAAWQMLSPKFQVESGGIQTYRRFWDSATNGRVLSISSNPDNLSVSYQVRFDNFDNGPGPTVLDLRFEDGRYLIDGERTQGFTPAG